MATRLLVTSAGTGPSNNLIRSLRAGEPALTILGGHDDPFVLQGSAADRRYLLPSASTPAGWARALARIASREAVDLVIPVTDADTAALSRHRTASGGASSSRARRSSTSAPTRTASRRA
jgi:hypothetical protein